ncbi:class I SAM-dependent methyltransferase [Streptomonospora litoralis]|uniref:Methyltransferase n=1 Tax=Streptomonospora litoralis TaxID=2498135 RepID=A0A4P6QAY2_9ACTN|nr:class I SAM-dependent methyltransferase [Streptomonospora litoralis]QBI56789.1 hypothetical protein EKD16_25240 [Streptomonospora litoralis]
MTTRTSVIDAGVVTEWARSKRHTGQTELSACRRLRALAASVPSGQAIVELGVYRGRATGWLLLGAQEGHGAHVTAVDPWGMRRDHYSPYSGTYSHPATYQAFKSHMDRIDAGPEVLTVKRGYARTTGAKWRGPAVGLLVHDAEHTGAAVAADLQAWVEHLADDAAVVVHGAAEPGVVAATARVLGTGYTAGWRYTGPDGWSYDEPVLIPWTRRPGRRGLVVAHRDPALLRPATPAVEDDPGGEEEAAPADEGPQQPEPADGDTGQGQAGSGREDEPEDAWS